MSSPWITGKKLMAQYDIPAILLGSACFGGALTAFRSDSLEEVKEILLVERIPKFPPVGVDALEHVQMGETVHWDWAKRWGCEFSISSEAEAFAEACLFKRGVAKSEWLIKERALLAMRDEFDFLIAGVKYCPKKYKGKFFFFNFDIYRKRNPNLSLTEAEEAYRSELGSMRFDIKNATSWAEAVYMQPRDLSAVAYIHVKSRVASGKQGKGRTQLINTLRENQCAYNQVRKLINEGVPILEIADMMEGGHKVKACLLFDDKVSPEAALKELYKQKKTCV